MLIHSISSITNSFHTPFSPTHIHIHSLFHNDQTPTLHIHIYNKHYNN